MNPSRPLILDLDGTLLHPEPAPDSLVIPGRTRPSYLSGASASALRALADRFPIFLATARSWSGTQSVVDGLADRGVPVEGVILEDGGLLGPPGNCRPLEPGRDWRSLRERIDRAKDPTGPEFTWQDDYEACLAARVADPATAPDLLRGFRDRLAPLETDLRWFRDGRKLFLAGRLADKWNAIRALLGDRAASAVGIGDGGNDLCWLSRVAEPCTLPGAVPGVLDVVRDRGGFVASAAGHDGIVEILRRLADWESGPG